MFCRVCGASLNANSGFCSSCGTATPSAASTNVITPPPQFQQAVQPPTPQKEQFTDRVFGVTNGVLFLVAIIFFTLGGTISVINTFSVFNLIFLGPVITVLSIIGFWMVFSASRDTALRLLPALTLFKVAAIMALVIFCIAMGLIMLALLIVSIAALAYEPVAGVIVLLGMLIIVAAFVVMLVFYYIALLRMIKGFRNNIIYNDFSPIRGVVPFTVMTVIGLVIAFLGMVFVFWLDDVSGDWLHYLIVEFGAEFGDYFDDALFTTGNNFGGLMVSAIATISTSVGWLLIVIVLNKINGSLKREAPRAYH
jgi:hypothetical protein